MTFYCQNQTRCKVIDNGVAEHIYKFSYLGCKCGQKYANFKLSKCQGLCGTTRRTFQWTSLKTFFFNRGHSVVFEF